MRKQAVIIPFGGGTLKGRIIPALEHSDIEALPGVTRFVTLGEEPNVRVYPLVDPILKAFHVFDRMVEGWDGLTRPDGSPRPFSPEEKENLYNYENGLAGMMMLAIEEAFGPPAEIKPPGEPKPQPGGFVPARTARPEDTEAAE